ncbi:MAG: type II toxin-antitoxin system VapC family toxin [Gaiellaceae bacterium]
MILADTSVLVDNLRGRPEARVAFGEAFAAGERIAASVLTKTEILAGVRRGEERGTQALLDEVEWVPVDDEIAEAAGRLARRYRESHPGVEVVDYVIAATAQELAGALWTTNVKHFPMFRELAAPY